MARRVLTGLGCAETIGAEVKRYGGKKVLIVCDRGVVMSGLLEKILPILRSEKLDVAVFDGVVPNPTTENVKDGTRFLKQKNCDIVIGLGGGSPLDCAKAVSAMATNPGRIEDYDGREKIPNRMLPLIAVNTTAGTGSEVTQWAVITDRKRKTKMAIASSNMMPDLAIEDPLLTVSLPPAVTASTGMDALTHAIEGYIAKDATPITDATGIAAIEVITSHLRVAFAEGENVVAREKMMYGQLLAGMCFCNAGVGNAHAMAHQLGGFYDIPHGLANAILLPYVMEFNLVANPVKFAKIAQASGEPVENLSIREAAEVAIRSVVRLSRDIQIPKTLKDVGVKSKDIPTLAKNAMTDLAIGTNPRATQPGDIRLLYHRALSGDLMTEI